MKYPILLYFCILLFLTTGCNSEKKRIIKGIAGDYGVDTTVGDYNVMSKPIYRNLKLKLLEDGRYYFTPSLKFLAGYNGTWTISDDDEFSYFIFQCNNGNYQMNRILSIEIIDNKHCYTIYFTKGKHNNNGT